MTIPGWNLVRLAGFERINGTMTLTTLSAANYGVDESFDVFVRQAQAMPVLEQEEEFELARRFRTTGDRKAFDILVHAYLRYVIRIARGFRGYGLPLADLVSEGNLGLIRAVEKFEPERGNRLSTAAMWWIRAAIGEFVVRFSSMVKIGTTAEQKKLFFKLKAVKRKLGINSPWLSDTDAERVARALAAPVKEVMEMDVRLKGVGSLNEPVNDQSDSDGSAERQDYLVSDAPTAEEILSGSDEFDKRLGLIGEALAVLKPRELDIFRSRRLEETPITLDELGAKHGVSRERVRQIEVTAINKVQRHMIEAALASGLLSEAPLSLH
ncbi:RNA polymerase sigma-32 factor [Bradyrhizobium sp. USDA 4341]